MLKTSLRLSENVFPAALRFKNDLKKKKKEYDVFTPNIDEQKTTRFRVFLTYKHIMHSID